MQDFPHECGTVDNYDVTLAVAGLSAIFNKVAVA